MYQRFINKIKYIGNKSGVLNYYSLLKRRRTALYKKSLYQKAEKGFLDYPRRFTFELTNRCNLKCRMCFQKNNVYEKELSLEQIDRVFGNLGPNCSLVDLTGGEIFMHRDLHGIIELLDRKYGKKCFIMTNGTLLDSSAAKKLFKCNNITGIQFSLDGTGELHNRIRSSRGAFQRTVEAIKLTKDRFRVSVSCVLLKDNLDNLGDLIKALSDIGVRDIAFTFEMFSLKAEIEESARILGMENTNIATYRKDTGQDYSFNTLTAAIKNCKKTGARLGVSVSVIPNVPKSDLASLHSGTLRKARWVACGELLDGRINFNGDIKHCPIINASFGSLLEEPFERIWDSHDFNLFRKRLIGNNLLPVCARCCKVEVM